MGRVFEECLRGVGATTAIFSVADALLIQPLPFRSVRPAHVRVG